jgi:acyl-CoA thioesterase FadM
MADLEHRPGGGLDVSGWVETYRGTVFPWEVDIVDHLTVAYYFERFADATLGLLDATGLGPSYMRAAGRGCVTVDCYVRYREELRVGDVLHIRSGVLGMEEAGLVMGHQVFNSDTGALCATVEQRAVHVDLGRRTPVPLATAQRRAVEARRVEWDGPARERRWQPDGVEGFRDAARDTVKPWEVDVFGQSAFPFYVHRFSAAGIQTFAAFGMTPAYLRAERRGMSTFEFQLAFRGELHPGDLVAVKTGLLHIGNSSLRLLHKMFNHRTGELVATLDQFGVHLDVEARRPTPFPAALRARAGAMLVRPA